jgi:hypothetical protein
MGQELSLLSKDYLTERFKYLICLSYITGYGIAYAGDMESYITPKESKFLDRLFLKALANTSFFQKLKENGMIEGKDVQRLDGAKTLYQQTGLYFFGDNEWAFRNFSDAKEYNMPLVVLQRAPLWTPSDKITEQLPESLDKALVEIERRCTPSEVKPEAVYQSPEFRNGAWQLYTKARELIPEILPTMRDRRTIGRRFEAQKEKSSIPLEAVLSYA